MMVFSVYVQNTLWYVVMAHSQCVTNSVDTKNFEIAEINILNHHVHRTCHLLNENEQGNATLILTSCDT
jgi:hypothetical protein